MTQTNETLNLFDVGCLVSLSIGSWSGRRMVSREDCESLGIDTKALPDELVNLGRKLLVSKSEIQAISKIEQRARYYLSQFSVPFGIANSFFVPLKIVPDLEHNLKQFRKEFFDVVDSFIVRFNDLKDEVKQRHPEFFEKCLKRFYPPTAESLRSRFYFDWHLFRIAGLNSLQGVSVSHIIEENEAKLEKSRQMKEKMQKEVGSFVEQYVGSMREEVIKFCDLVKCRINGTPFADEEEGKKLSPKTLTSFRKYIDKFKMLNVFGDSDLEKMLNEFREQFLDAEFNGKTLESPALQSAILSATNGIRKAASMENEQTSQFIKGLKRKVVI